jgi:hypothetical protein
MADFGSSIRGRRASCACRSLSPIVVSLAAACLLVVAGVSGARANAPQQTRGLRVEWSGGGPATCSRAVTATVSCDRSPFTGEFSHDRRLIGVSVPTRDPLNRRPNARAALGGDAPPSLSDVVSNPDIQTSLENAASIAQKGSKALTKLIFAAAYVAGAGLAIVGVYKLKKHKDNPQQTALGRPVQLLAVGATLPQIDFVLAVAAAHIFKQEREAEAIAASEERQAGADPPEGGFARVALRASAVSPSLAGLGRDARFARLFLLQNRELVVDAGLARVGRAEVRALERSSVALSARDHAAYEEQKAAVAKYLGEEATLLTEGVALRHEVLAAFRALKIGLHISHLGMVRLARSIAAHGLRGIRRGLERWGVTPARVGLGGVSSSQLVSQFSAAGNDFDLSRLFWDSAGQDAADQHLARLLRRAAHAAKKLP